MNVLLVSLQVDFPLKALSTSQMNATEWLVIGVFALMCYPFFVLLCVPYDEYYIHQRDDEHQQAQIEKAAKKKKRRGNV